MKVKGYQVAAADDGVAAVEAVTSFVPAVVLMDIGMPKTNGDEAARYIRNQNAGAWPTLIAMTGRDGKRIASAPWTPDLTIT